MVKAVVKTYFVLLFCYCNGKNSDWIPYNSKNDFRRLTDVIEALNNDTKNETYSETSYCHQRLLEESSFTSWGVPSEIDESTEWSEALQFNEKEDPTEDWSQMMFWTHSTEYKTIFNCQNAIKSGNPDDEDSSIEDWSIYGVNRGSILTLDLGPPGISSSYRHVGRTHISSGPGQKLDSHCLEEGKQYILRAMLLIMDEKENAAEKFYACDKYAEWLDPDFCPLFTIVATTEKFGVAKYNIGNDVPLHLEWMGGEWNPYYAIFTVDSTLATSSEAYIYIRGPRPGVTIVFTDVKMEPFFGADTRYNFWSSQPPDKEIDFSITEEENPTLSMSDLITMMQNVEYEYEHYGSDGETFEAYDGSCTQLVKYGDAESENLSEWERAGDVGTLSLHPYGPGKSTKSFRNHDRVHFNNGFGQYFDLSCFEFGKLYEVKAKYKLIDENGFPYSCDTQISFSCPMFTFNMNYNGRRYPQTILNDMNRTQVAETFNEFHGVFIASDVFVRSSSVFWWFRGPRGGSDILFDDVSITKYSGIEYEEDEFNKHLVKSLNTTGEESNCTEMITSGESTQNILDWEIKGNSSGSLHYIPDMGYESNRPAFVHMGREHASTGPGQDIDMECFTEGTQLLLTGKIKLYDEIKREAFQCDPCAEFLDPNFCPIFTIASFFTFDISSEPSVTPSSAPSETPSGIPSAVPSSMPSIIPSTKPTASPSTVPSLRPSRSPSLEPTILPTVKPSMLPSTYPSFHPSKTPSTSPTVLPSVAPSTKPTSYPSVKPSPKPTSKHSILPSSGHSILPSKDNSVVPTLSHSSKPSLLPTYVASAFPSMKPTILPSAKPSAMPSIEPSADPSMKPSLGPSSRPSPLPSIVPSTIPSSKPTLSPSKMPSSKPSIAPTGVPSLEPSVRPSKKFSQEPSVAVSTGPSKILSEEPSILPSSKHSKLPSWSPSIWPSALPSASKLPTTVPTTLPSKEASTMPSLRPSHSTSASPTFEPTQLSTKIPSLSPSMEPSLRPSHLTSAYPTFGPSQLPTKIPSFSPSMQPSTSTSPSNYPSVKPSIYPSASLSLTPSTKPSLKPSLIPSIIPSSAPSIVPSMRPSAISSTVPSSAPSTIPSTKPSTAPSLQPSYGPTSNPSMASSVMPTIMPTAKASHHPSGDTSISPTVHLSTRPSPKASMLPSNMPSVVSSSHPSQTPSKHPSVLPSQMPSKYPSEQPSNKPSTNPSVLSSIEPSVGPSSIHSMEPSQMPSEEPSDPPTKIPSSMPTLSNKPSMYPSVKPSPHPTILPSLLPSANPTFFHSMGPSVTPSVAPSVTHSSEPSLTPSQMPSSEPTFNPTIDLTVLLANYNIGNNVHNCANGSNLTTIQDGGWIDFRAVFTVDERLSLASSAYIYIRGPRPGATIMYDKISLTKYIGEDTPNNGWSSPPPPEGIVAEDITMTIMETPLLTMHDRRSYLNEEYIFIPDMPLEVPTDPCEELVKNGDAEGNSVSGWEIHNPSRFSQLLIEPIRSDYGTKSFIHTKRSSHNSGPQQRLEVQCLQENMDYEFSAKIKLTDENGFPFKCDQSKPWQHSQFCVLFVIGMVDEDGFESYVVKFNDFKGEWFGEIFNEFRVTFKATTDFWTSSQVYWTFKGPRAGVSIIFDDVSLRPFEFQVSPTENFEQLLPDVLLEADVAETIPISESHFPLCTQSCCEMVVDGDARSGNPGSWIPERGGEIKIHRIDPNRNRVAFKHLYRTSVHSGPSQYLNPGCFVEGHQYEFKAQFKLYDHQGVPYVCTTNIFNQPNACPLLTIKITYPNGDGKNFVSVNQADGQFDDTNPHTFKVYRTIFTATSDLCNAETALLLIRGLPEHHILMFDKVSLSPYLQNSAPHFEISEYKEVIDPTCEGGCCNLARNGKAPSVFEGGWDAIGGGVVDVVDGHYRHHYRTDINSGPGQAIDKNCLIPGGTYRFTTKFMLEDSRYGFYTCTTRRWGKGKSCPVMSIGMRTLSGMIKWIICPDVYGPGPGTRSCINGMLAWKFNIYYSMFTVPLDFDPESIVDCFFMIRGLPPSTIIHFDEVTFEPYRFTPDPIAKIEKSVCVGSCCEIVKNGNFKNPDISDWIAFGIGWLQSSTSDGMKHIFRGSVNDGPGQYINPACLIPGKRYELKAMLKVAYPDGTYYACSLNVEWRDPDICPIFSVSYRTQDGNHKWFASLPQVGVSGWSPNVFNAYQTVFTVPDDMYNATDVYFAFRGPPEGNIIQLNDVSITPFGHYFTGDPDDQAPYNLFDDPYWSDGPEESVSGEVLSNMTSATNTTTFFGNNSTSFYHGFNFGGDTNSLINTSSTTENSPIAPTQSAPSTFGSTFTFVLAPSPPTPYDDSAFSNKAPLPSPLAPDPTLPYGTGPCEMFDDFENGDHSGWSLNDNRNGDISVASDNGNHYLLVSNREKLSVGPMHSLNPNCFDETKQYEISAKIKLLDESKNEVYCDKLDSNQDDTTCPLLTLKIHGYEGVKWLYFPNQISNEWVIPGWNEYKAYIQIDRNLASARSIVYYFEGSRAGIDMIFDSIEVSEYQPIPDGNIQADVHGKEFDVTMSCENLIVNGNAEAGDTRGWRPRMGGTVSIRPEGAGLTQYSFQHSGRTSFIMGPMHDLAVGCLIEGARYEFDAKIKLLDENEEPFQCDKEHLWVDELACPLLTFQLETISGVKYLYYPNEAPGIWNADSWNNFHAYIDVNEDISQGLGGEFFLERPRAGIIMIIDEVTITRDCTVLVLNNNGDTGSFAGWMIMNGGVLMRSEGSNGRSTAIGHYQRTSYEAGVGHYLDVGCLVGGASYAFTAKFKLLDESSNTPVVCVKSAPSMDPSSCPMFSIALVLSNGSNEMLNMPNEITLPWTADEFNPYLATFTVTTEMAEARGAYMIVKGPRPGVAVLFDEFSVDINYPSTPNCGDQLIENYHFDDSNTEGWTGTHGGILTLVPEKNGYALKTGDRVSASSGPMATIPTLCLIEGKQYELRLDMKLLDENDQPFACDKKAPYGSPLSCPVVGIHYETPTGIVMTHPENDDSSQWRADDCNNFHAIFTVTSEMALASSATIVVKGAAAGIGIVIDNFVFRTYYLFMYDCTQLVRNTNAEAGLLTHWEVHGVGDLSMVEGGYCSPHAFGYFGREQFWNGPMQEIDVSCLAEGMVFDFSAQLKLLDTEGNPYACNKGALWLHKTYCPLLSFQVTDSAGEFINHHFVNEYGAPWVADSFNHYRSKITITEDMANAEKLSFYFQGPEGGISIIFDAITMHQENDVSVI